MNEKAVAARAEWKSHWTLMLLAMAGMPFHTALTCSLGSYPKFTIKLV